MAKAIGDRGHLASVGLSHCYIWYRAVASQADRLATTGWVIEGYLCVVALRNLRRAAELVASALDDTDAAAAARTAIGEFDRMLPGMKNARDVLEHFDAYATGTGRLQRRAADEPYDVDISIRPAAGGGTQFVLHVGPFEVPVADAAAAACRLHADIYASGHDDPAVTSEWSRQILCDGAGRGVIPEHLAPAVVDGPNA
jgi:hypothetical protein